MPSARELFERLKREQEPEAISRRQREKDAADLVRQNQAHENSVREDIKRAQKLARDREKVLAHFKIRQELNELNQSLHGRISDESAANGTINLFLDENTPEVKFIEVRVCLNELLDNYGRRANVVKINYKTATNREQAVSLLANAALHPKRWDPPSPSFVRPLSTSDGSYYESLDPMRNCSGGC